MTKMTKSINARTLSCPQPVVLTKKTKVGPAEEKQVPATGIVLFIASDILGRGDNRQQGSLLMQSFLHTVGGLRSSPQTIIFINNGVKLVANDSLVLGELRQLQSQGVEILLSL